MLEMFKNSCWLMMTTDYTSQYIGEYNHPIRESALTQAVCAGLQQSSVAWTLFWWAQLLRQVGSEGICVAEGRRNEAMACRSCTRGPGGGARKLRFLRFVTWRFLSKASPRQLKLCLIRDWVHTSWLVLCSPWYECQSLRSFQLIGIGVTVG